MTQKKRALVVGAGASGLVAAKELLEAGIEDVVLLERGAELGGVWLNYCWDSLTLSSSKWTTEFGAYPMPDDYPDFLTPQHMTDYLRGFAGHFGLLERIRYGVTVRAVQRNAAGQYDIVTDKETYRDYAIVVLCSGAVGRPRIPDFPGLDGFGGAVIHSAEYKEPSAFQGKRVLSIGLGESGVGIGAEISSVAARTIVSATSYTPAPRVQPYASTPFEQMTWWPLGRYCKDYQELLTLEVSWYQRLPKRLRPLYARLHPILRLFPEGWLPKAWAPYYWHSKYWPKPGRQFGDVSGNLTRPEVPVDDILYLLHSGRIEPRGRVQRFAEEYAYFEDGGREQIDAVVVNTGYEPAIAFIDLPGGWRYRHQDLYKGCLHPELPDLAFVGTVRPTIGSIPAMAEMQARFVAAVLTGQLALPAPERLGQIVEQEAAEHARECPAMQTRFPHVYFFDRWMEEMAELIGCQPKLRNHLGSWRQLQAYLLGASMPLRYRLRGPGAVKNAYERYAHRVVKVFNTGYGFDVRMFIIARFLYPYLLTLLLAAGLFWGVKLPVVASLGLAALFLVLYMKVDLFRFALALPFLFIVKKRAELFLFEYTPEADPGPKYRNDFPDYAAPRPFQKDAEPLD